MAGKTTTQAANHLRAWRRWVGENRRRDMTQAELADLAGTTTGVISELESGRTQLGAKWLERLGRALGVPPGYLMFDPYDANMDILRAALEVEPGAKEQVIQILGTFRKRR